MSRPPSAGRRLSSVRQTLQRAFGVRSNELRPVLWLVAHSLFVGLFNAFFVVATNSLLLSRFPISFLPLAYIASAIVGWLVVLLFSRLSRQVPLRRLLVLSLAFVLAVAAALWLLALATGSAAVVFLLFVWATPALSLLALGYWALAGRMFDLRQGKRLFALVGAGEEVSTVLGLFSIPGLVRLLGGPLHLLPVALGGLVGCLAVVVAINSRFAEAVGGGAEDERAQAGEKRSPLRELVSDRYFLLMTSLIVLLNVGNYVVDFGFLAQVRGRFAEPIAIAQFLGVFFGATKTIELLTKVFVSGRVLSQFGLKFGLTALPVLLGSCALLAIAVGTLGAAAAHFFVLVALSKLVWMVGRTTTFEPTFRVLYQPVRAVDRISFQTHVEGTGRQIGTAIVGVALLLFSRQGAIEAIHLFYALLPLLGLWIVASLWVHRDYHTRLIESLWSWVASRVEAKGARRPLDLLEPELHSGDAQRRVEALHLLSRIEPSAVGRALAGMVEHPEPAVRTAALAHIGRERLAALGPAVASRSEDEDPAVRRTARETAGELRRIEAQALAAAERVHALVASSDPADRALAAEAIGRDGRDAERLWMLLFDADWNVRRSALAAAGRSQRDEFWPQIVSELSSASCWAAASAALVEAGERALPEIEKAFHKSGQSAAVRRRIVDVEQAIGGAQAHALLVEKLSFPDQAIRHRALRALSRAAYQAPPELRPPVVRAIETLVARMAWNMSAVLDLGEESALSAARRALEEEIEAARAGLLSLLSLSYDPDAIGLVRENVEGGSSERTVYALEILELVLDEEVKPLVVPILEGLSYPQVLRRLDALLPRHRLERVERLGMIVNRDFDAVGIWTRACALRGVAKLAGVAPDLVASLFHPHPLMQEVAAFSMLQLDAAAYRRHRVRLSYEVRERLDHAMADTLEHWDARSTFGRIQLLRRLPACASLPPAVLVPLAEQGEEVVLNPRRRLPSPRAPSDSFYVNLDGEVLVADGSGASRPLPRRSLIAFGAQAAPLEVCKTARFVRLEPEPLFELAAERVELVPALLAAQRQAFAEPAAQETAPAEVAEEATA